MPTDQDQQQREAEIRARVAAFQVGVEQARTGVPNGRIYRQLAAMKITAQACEDVPFLLDALDRERAALQELREAADELLRSIAEEEFRTDGGGYYLHVLRVVGKRNGEDRLLARLRALLHPESTGQEDER